MRPRRSVSTKVQVGSTRLMNVALRRVSQPSLEQTVRHDHRAAAAWIRPREDDLVQDLIFTVAGAREALGKSGGP